MREIRRRGRRGCSGVENQARISVALPTTGPVGSPVGDPPSGSIEMAKRGARRPSASPTRARPRPGRRRRGTGRAAAARRCRRWPTIARSCPPGSASARASTGARWRCRRSRRSAPSLPSIMKAATIGAGAAVVDRRRRDRHRARDHEQPEQAGGGERRGDRERLPIARRGAARASVEPGDDALANARARARPSGTAANKAPKCVAPALDVAREAGLGEHAAQRRGTLLAVEQAQRQLGGGDVGFGPGGGRSAQSSPRQSFRRMSPRRTQLFIVPSGTASRSASSA